MSNDRTALRFAAVAALIALLIPYRDADAQGAKPLAKCAADAVVAGTVCMDKYEASVWRVPDPLTTNKSLVKKIRLGKVKVADLVDGGATQLGVTPGPIGIPLDDYAPCADNGQNCADDVYAVSLAGVTPSAEITWFQALAACENSRKRLPTNVEWQAAVQGTPDPVSDDGTSGCNILSSTFKLPEDPVPTGSRSSCVSSRGVFDMVGNLDEWVADWVPRGTTCGAWSIDVSPSGDSQCLAGAATTGEPGALLRGGRFLNTMNAGPFHVIPDAPSNSVSYVGFRCAR
jgi:hypothetical protein